MHDGEPLEFLDERLPLTLRASPRRARGVQDQSLGSLAVDDDADLGAAGQLPVIREWFAAGLVDDSYATPADIAADIQRSPAECLAALQDAGRGLIDDVARETALWPAFHELPPVQLPPIPLGSLREPIRRDETKVGRNDPCPCGSGRKYKKCHGAAV